MVVGFSPHLICMGTNTLKTEQAEEHKRVFDHSTVQCPNFKERKKPSLREKNTISPDTSTSVSTQLQTQ